MCRAAIQPTPDRADERKRQDNEEHNLKTLRQHNVGSLPQGVFLRAQLHFHRVGKDGDRLMPSEKPLKCVGLELQGKKEGHDRTEAQQKIAHEASRHSLDTREDQRDTGDEPHGHDPPCGLEPTGGALPVRVVFRSFQVKVGS